MRSFTSYSFSFIQNTVRIKKTDNSRGIRKEQEQNTWATSAEQIPVVQYSPRVQK